MIRIVETKNAALLARLCEPVHSLHHTLYPDIFKPYDAPGLLDFFTGITNSDSCKAFLAMQGDTAAGYMLLMVKKIPANNFKYAYESVEIDQLLVLPDFRRKGIGKMLLEHAAVIAEESGIKILEINHWNENKSAGKLFSENGFEYQNHRMKKVLS